jgi:hypothetical protein
MSANSSQGVKLFLISFSCLFFCLADLGQGSCDVATGRCACAAGFGSADCSARWPRPHQILSERLAAPDQRDIVSRAGHSLVIDYHAVGWLFGGLHPDRGLLQDVR